MSSIFTTTPTPLELVLAPEDAIRTRRTVRPPKGPPSPPTPEPWPAPDEKPGVPKICGPKPPPSPPAPEPRPAPDDKLTAQDHLSSKPSPPEMPPPSPGSPRAGAGAKQGSRKPLPPGSLKNNAATKPRDCSPSPPPCPPTPPMPPTPPPDDDARGGYDFGNLDVEWGIRGGDAKGKKKKKKPKDSEDWVVVQISGAGVKGGSNKPIVPTKDEGWVLFEA
ncbi:MAG: hypothetical protein MMC23_002583 [Stictis urceolatum]|nr:hypothetical protein [Stictis urceolata]